LDSPTCFGYESLSSGRREYKGIRVHNITTPISHVQR